MFKPNEFNEKLEATVESFDHEGAARLCDELIVHLRERDDPYPADRSKTVLALLRGKRYFDLMQSVADALIQTGQTAARVRRQYAQSQLDLGNYTAAIGALENLEHDTSAGGACEDTGEYAEAQGLLGRAYKDLYVAADNPKLGRNRDHLEKAISYYRKIYQDDPEKVWQGINSVALMRRAESDGLELASVADPKLLADSMAAEILAKIKQRHQNKKADTWDFATALEACIGLARDEEALTWLTRYLKSDHTDAFELGSTHRQLTQVWKLHPGQAPGDRILPTLRGTLLERQGSEIQIAVKDAGKRSLEELAKDSGYEKILGTEGFKSFKWFQKCMHRAASVARVEDSMEEAIGTAFVVRGGDLKPELGEALLLLTNAHVISSDPLVSRALRPTKAKLHFELWEDGQSPKFDVQELWSSPPELLDATLLQPTPKIENVEPTPIAEVLPLAGADQRAYIIGHPQGRKLSFSIHDNHLLDHDERLLHYRSPTEPGNSGSPVFNDEWELIGLHHRGLRKMPRLHEKGGVYPANEGIWIQAIIKDLKESTWSTELKRFVKAYHPKVREHPD